MSVAKELEDTSWLVKEWGIDFTDEGRNLCAEHLQLDATNKDKKSLIKEYIMNSDIRKVGMHSMLPADINKINNNNGSVYDKTADNAKIRGFIVMIVKCSDISRPTKMKEEEDNSGAMLNTNAKLLSMQSKKRLLYLVLNDGKQRFNAFEYRFCKNLTLENLLPGTKLLLKNKSFNNISASSSELFTRNDLVLLCDNDVQVLGGHVDRMIEAFNADNELKEHRMLGSRSGASKRNQDADDGNRPPRFVPYGHSSDQQDRVKELKATASSSTKQASFISSNSKTHDEGPRFKVSDLVSKGDNGSTTSDGKDIVKSIDNILRQPKLNMDTFGSVTYSQPPKGRDQAGRGRGAALHEDSDGDAAGHSFRDRGKRGRGRRGERGKRGYAENQGNLESQLISQAKKDIFATAFNRKNDESENTLVSTQIPNTCPSSTQKSESVRQYINRSEQHFVSSGQPYQDNRLDKEHRHAAQYGNSQQPSDQVSRLNNDNYNTRFPVECAEAGYPALYTIPYTNTPSFPLIIKPEGSASRAQDNPYYNLPNSGMQRGQGMHCWSTERGRGNRGRYIRYRYE